MVSQRADNAIAFAVPGFNLNGNLTIRAKFEVVGPARVAVHFVDSRIQPPALQSIFEMNEKLLLDIFNPEGWLDITYLDANFRVGRDNKGNIFLLERIQSSPENEQNAEEEEKEEEDDDDDDDEEVEEKVGVVA